MKVRMTIPPGASVKVTRPGRTAIDLEPGDTLEIEPFFTLSNGSADVIRSEVLVGRSVISIDNRTLSVSGSSGKLSLKGVVLKSAVPAIDTAQEPFTDAAK